MKTLRILFLCSAVLLLGLVQSSAQLMLDQFADTGVSDLAGLSLNVSYNSGTGLFTVSGYAPSYILPAGHSDPAGTSWPVTGNDTDFSITAHINNSGILSSGTLSITGDLYDNAGHEVLGGRQVLLTANLQAGPQGSPLGSAYDYLDYYNGLGGGEFDGTQFAFAISVNGGALAADFGGQGIIELYPSGTNPFGDFTTSYSNDAANGAADVFSMVPEPSAILLFLIGGVVWSAARRRCRSSLSSAAPKKN